MILNSKHPVQAGRPVGEKAIRRNPEMMFYLYLPIKLADQSAAIGKIYNNIPENLKVFGPMIQQILEKERATQYRNVNFLDDKYIYLTVKTLFVTPEYIGGRPGWHTDGFGTNDINWIWASDTPTEFCIQDFDVDPDEHLSIEQMTVQASDENIHTYGNNILRLTPETVHRCPIVESPRLRTFFRLSISDDRYNMAGNSHNHLLDYDWKLQSRGEERNTTTK